MHSDNYYLLSSVFLLETTQTLHQTEKLTWTYFLDALKLPCLRAYGHPLANTAPL